MVDNPTDPELTPSDRVTDTELHDLQAHFNHLPDLAPLHRSEADNVVRLVQEVRRLRRLLVKAYDHVLDTPGEELQAELEREVAEIRAAERSR